MDDETETGHPGLVFRRLPLQRQRGIVNYHLGLDITQLGGVASSSVGQSLHQIPALV